MEPIGCAEMSVYKYRSRLRKILKEGKSQMLKYIYLLQILIIRIKNCDLTHTVNYVTQSSYSMTSS